MPHQRLAGHDPRTFFAANNHFASKGALALGVADGHERDSALHHIGGCPSCRRLVWELSAVTDDLLMLAPEHEAPSGLEDRVLDAISFAERERVRALSPELTKGLEFDLVVLVRPEAFGDGIEGAVDHYVAMTRATQQLVVLG